ncbi:MAG: winged helix-turn-helix transcriptional regulator [Gluconacetobacter diazotrophicus]|nr:winged helix-turn-helix transcriptional regulator [Gluconacetobacter diazotrophicus]
MQLSPLEVLGFSIKRLQYRNYRAADARLAPLGISLVQWNALREIGRHPGLCMHGLAELTFNSDQAFGTLMNRLLRQKLIERHPGEGRANVHRLTPRGQTLVAAGHKALREALARSFAPLDADERARLRDLLAKVLGDEFPDAAPRHPVTRFAKTLVGIVPEPGQPMGQPGRQAPRKRVR